MTVRELINKLLDCDMNAVITVGTSNKDSQGRLHTYEFTGVDKEDMYLQMFDEDKYGQKMYLPLKFHNWEFDHEVNGEE